ncbi:hypothetical protein BDZ89DRAFT_1145725 [Hymenopellis radicata]|nr:hypothetical protein BDZ89DRAFT_1145725 [Hymenopellis radicata]
MFISISREFLRSTFTQWVGQSYAAYQPVVSITAKLILWAELVFDRTPPTLAPIRLLDEIQTALTLKIFDMLYELDLHSDMSGTEFTEPAYETLFRANVVLGPGGLINAVTLLSRIYEFLSRLADLPSPSFSDFATADHLHSQTVKRSNSICGLLLYFRARYPRTLWEVAGGCREFLLILEVHRYRLQIGSGSSDFYVHAQPLFEGNLLLPTRDLVKQFEFILGDSKDPKHMNVDLLVAGEFGLDGFLTNVVQDFLDTVDISDTLYKGSFRVLDQVCQALARKIRNFAKRRHQYNKGADNVTPEEREADKQDAFRRRTRSSKNASVDPSKDQKVEDQQKSRNRKNGNWRFRATYQINEDYYEIHETDSPDDMSDLGSINDDWYWNHILSETSESAAQSKAQRRKGQSV